MSPFSESSEDKNVDSGELDHEDLEESKDREKGVGTIYARWSSVWLHSAHILKTWMNVSLDVLD